MSDPSSPEVGSEPDPPLLVIGLSGRPGRSLVADTDPGGTAARLGVIGVEVGAREIDGVAHTVVQLLVDDDAHGFDPSLLDGPIVADLVAEDGSVIARDLFDHDRFRRQLRAERDLGRSVLRGVLVLTGGELPPPWVRLAFLPVDLRASAGTTLVLRRATVASLVEGVERADAAGMLTAAERSTALTSIEQRHPDWN